MNSNEVTKENQWHYAAITKNNSNQEQHGPIDESVFIDKLKNGEIPQEVLVWTEGMNNWINIKETKLNQYFANTPPPLNLTISSPPPLNVDSKNITNSKLADFGDRFLAGLIDAVVLAIPQLILNMIIPLIGPILIGLPYYLYFMSESGGGRTIGYKALKLRLVDENTGLPINTGSTLLWYLGTWVLGIGWIWFFTDNRKRMLHNIMSKTIVIKENL